MTDAFWETRDDAAILLESEPFRRTVFSSFDESPACRPKSPPGEEKSVAWESKVAYDEWLLRALHAVGVQVFGNVQDDEEADFRLKLLRESYRRLVPESIDLPVSELAARLGTSEPTELRERYLISLEDRKTSGTFNDARSRSWIANAFRRWLARRGSDLDSLAVAVARLARTSLLMQSAFSEMPAFLGGFDGYPFAAFKEIGRELVHSCRPVASWTCMDAKLTVRGRPGSEAPWTVNLVPHLDAFRRSCSDQWKRISALAVQEGVLDEYAGVDEPIRGRGHAEMLRLLHGISCRCDGSSLWSEARLAAEEAFFETERRCGRCGKWSAASSESGREKMRRCSGCKFQRYCNETCQRLHWGTHRRNCSSMLDRSAWKERLYRAALAVSQGANPGR